LSAQYDDIAREYQATKQSPLRQHVEAHTFYRILGDVKGKKVLDLACGDGFYTRGIAEAGAAEVVGVDISAEMIALANELEEQAPLGIRYHVADAAELPELGVFDVVTAAYLFHYAPNRGALQAMCRNAAAQLAPGGRLVCINENPFQSFDRHAGYTQYGFNKSSNEVQQDEARITYAMISGRQMIRFDVFYYGAETYAAALRDAGFASVDWFPLQLEASGQERYGAEYWQEYMENPPVIGLVCTL
jgi:ubiquinone/menaquinone biosynthesis C-methylase UbiE